MYVFCEQPRCKDRHIVLFEMVGNVAVYAKRKVRIDMLGPFCYTCPECGHREWYGQEAIAQRDTITVRR